MGFSFLELLKAYAGAWAWFGNINVVVFMLAGMCFSLFFGALPGVSSLVAVGLFLMFVPYLRPEQVLPFIAGAMSSGSTGGCVTTVLLGIPGTSPNAATLLDGYTMSKNGQAGRALGLGVAASGAGCVYSAVWALAMVPLVLPMVMAINSPEMVFLVIMGLAAIATLARGSAIKGVISGILGILFSLVGLHLVTGIDRYTFGSLYLREGLPMVAVFMGVFAIPEMVSLGAAGSTIARQGTIATLKGMQEVMAGVKELFTRHKRLNAISSLIGYIVGIIPGIGAVVASWVAYGQAKHTSRHPERFGTGCPEGIVAPESSNNASAGGALLTTFALGIPGSEGGALLLVAIILLGIVPGPEMLTKHLALTLNSLLIIAVAGILGAVICILLAPTLAKVTFVSGHILFPLMISIVVFGVFALNSLYPDVIVLFLTGILGVLMKESGYNRPAFVVGFILGSLFEKYLFISLAAWGPLFFLRPLSIVIILATIALVFYRPLLRLFRLRVSLRGAE